MSTRKLVILITFLAVFTMAARVSVDSDTWWHLRAGQWILQNRAIPQTDVFSSTRLGASWKYPGWLVEIPMYLLYQVGGIGALNLWTALMVTLAFFFVWMTLSGGVFLRAFVIILAAAVSGVYWAARPYLVTFVLAAVFLYILESWRWKPETKTDRQLWFLPAFMLIWANSHGGFAVGFILLCIYLANELLHWLVYLWLRSRNKLEDVTEVSRARSRLLRLLVVLVLMLAAVCISPAGPAMLLYPLKTISIGSLQEYIQEWQSPDFHSRQVQPFLALFLLTFASVGTSRRRLALTDFLLVTGFAYMGFLAVRNIALFAVVAPPVLTRYAVPTLAAINQLFGIKSDQDEVSKGKLRWVNVFLLVLLASAAVFKVSQVLTRETNDGYIQKIFPIKAVEYIKDIQPPGKLFNSYNDGGFLIWMLPEYPVFIDGRTDLYDDEIIQEWLKIYRAEAGWEEALDHYGIHVVLVEPGAPIARSLVTEPGWQEGFRDVRAVVFIKDVE